MSPIGLWIALAIAAAVGLVFGIYPQLDLAISAYFFDPEQGAFPLRMHPLPDTIRNLAEWILILLVAPAIIALAMKFIRPQRAMLLSGRTALFLIATVALGPGLLVNVILKEQWSRPRPIAVTEFGGTQPFVPWWDPRGECPRNCSFVSGEASSAFWTVAPAMLVPASWRVLALSTATAYAVVLSGLRVAVGAHFFTDIVFAAILTFLIIWFLYWLLFLRRPTQQSGDPVERAIERWRRTPGRHVTGR